MSGGPPGAQGRMAGGPLQRARLALMNGQPALAEEVCRRELEKRPNGLDARLLLTQALLQQQRAKEAVVEARQTVELQPKNVDALILLASALVQSNQVNPPKESQEVAERAVQISPKAARTHVQLAEVLMARRDFARAREEADTATQLEPRLAAGHLIRGMALLELKDYEGALQASQSALRYDSSMGVAYVGKARALTELKRTNEAMAAIDEAQRLSPFMQPSQLTQLRAQVHVKQRHYLDAYRTWLRFTRQTVKNPFMAPLTALLQLITTVFGQFGIFLILVLIALIFFGISRIPLVGGWIVAALLVALVGFGAWNAVGVLSGRKAPEMLRDPVKAVLGVGALALVLAAVFVISAWIAGRSHPHVGFFDWFTPLSVGIGGPLAFIAAAVVLRFAGGTARRA